MPGDEIVRFWRWETDLQDLISIKGKEQTSDEGFIP